MFCFSFLPINISKILLWTECLCSPPKFIYWSPKSCMVVFGDTEAVRLRWGHEGRAPWWNLCPYEKRKRSEFCLSLPCEETVKMWPSANQKEGSCQELNQLAPVDLPDSRQSGLWEINVCFDWEIDTCCACLWYFVIATWTKTHLKVNLSRTDSFYSWYGSHHGRLLSSPV